MTKLTFLGTGTSQGVPVISCNCRVCQSPDNKDKRLRASVLIETDDIILSIDAGPDFRQQMLRENVQRLDAILLTHAHKDHISGLDDVRAFNYTSGKPVDIYAEPRVQQVIKKDFDYAFAEHKYPGVPEINLHDILPDTPFKVKNLRIVPIRGIHYKLPVMGFRIGRVAYLTDMNRIDPREIDKIKGIDTLVINALRKEPHLSHFTLNEAQQVSRLVSPRITYFTHISHQMGCHEQEEAILPESFHFAYDGLQIEIKE